MKIITKLSLPIVLAMAMSCSQAPVYDSGKDSGNEENVDEGTQGGDEVPDEIQIENGTTLYGRITDENGKPVEGVAVSDGYTVVETDADGVYQIVKNALAHFVFYTTPSEYEINRDDEGYPKFYESYDRSDDLVRKDFCLKSLTKDETNFKLICISDPQCKTPSDIGRYRTETIPDVEATARQYLDEGISVYGVTLGDITFDTPQNWGDMREAMANLNIPIFQAIGNHDHLQNVTGETAATQNYEEYFGPRDYSFDRGDAHIVVMDNVIYKGGAGGSNYSGGISDSQLSWLTADLALVPKDKLVIFCAHIPFRDLSDATNESKRNGDAVIELLAKFQEAHLMIGHTHYSENWVHETNGKNIIEHIHGSACGAWWSDSFCVDGTPNGYAVYDIQASTIDDYYYKGTGLDKNVQIRAYSGTEKFGESGSATGVTTVFGWGANSETYNDPKCVIANVWNAIVPSRCADADLLWKVELWQNGNKVCDMKSITTTEWWAYANLVIRYGKSKTGTYSNGRPHIFYGMLNSGDTENDSDESLDFEVRATDQFGHVYKCSSLQRGLLQ